LGFPVASIALKHAYAAILEFLPQSAFLYVMTKASARLTQGDIDGCSGRRNTIFGFGVRS
jgi:hypothetical protein